MDRKVELRFVPNKQKRGLHCPDFDFEYLMDGRRITERSLGALICSDLQNRAYVFNLAKILHCMTQLAWDHFNTAQDYPNWLIDDVDITLRRPVGRPKGSGKPRQIAVDGFRLLDADEVPTPAENLPDR